MNWMLFWSALGARIRFRYGALDSFRERHIDAPIIAPIQDVLGRAEFSRALARILERGAVEGSLVIALRGAWGSGKTSIKNLTVDELRRSMTSAYGAIEFNPWQWTTEEAISRAFYREIAVGLGHKEHSIGSRARAEKFRRYATMLSTIASGVKSKAGAAPTLVALYTYIGGLSLAAGLLLPTLQVKTVASLVLSTGGVIALFAAALRYFGRDRARNEPLEIAQFELIKELRKIDHNIVVVVDDIDRLEPDQIRLIFRLVKTNAMLPRLSFLLIYQKEIVESAYVDAAPGFETSFVDKIVQVAFDVPLAERNVIERTLLSELELLHSQIRGKMDNDNIAFANLWGGGMRNLFTNLRDVKRFITGLKLQLELHQGVNTFEVNLTDLVALEVIRYFDAKLYAKISEAKDLLTFTRKVGKDQKEEVKKLFHGTASEENENLKHVSAQLFPIVEYGLSSINFEPAYNEEGVSKIKIRVERFFDRYFALRIPSTQITESEFQSIISSENDTDAVLDHLSILDSRGALTDFIFRLDETNKSLDPASLQVLLPVLFELAERFSSQGGFTLQTPFVSLWRACSWFIQSEADMSRRKEVFIQSIHKSKTLIVPGIIIGLDVDIMKEGRQGSRNLTFSEADLNDIKQVWCDEVSSNAKQTSSFIGQRHFVQILYQWKEFGNYNEVSTFVNALVDDDETFSELIDKLAYQQQSLSAGDYAPSSQQSSYIKRIIPFMFEEKLKYRLETLSVSPDAEIARKFSEVLAIFNKRGPFDN